MNIARRRGLITSSLTPEASLLFEDLFSDSSKAEKGTRKETDTESKLTITSGDLLCSGGKSSPAYGDPGYWLDNNIIRKSGHSVSCFLTISDVTSSLEMGFDDSNASGNLNSGSFRIGSDTIKTYEGGTLGPTIYTPSDSTEYGLAVVLRTNGAFYLIRVNGVWRLIWNSFGSSYNNTPVKGGIANYNAAWSVSNFKISKGTIIKPSLSDKFKRSDGSLGSSDGFVTPEGGGDSISWNGSTWVISSQKAVNTPTLGAEKITDGGLETNYTSGKCDTLSKSGSPSLSESADTHQGTKAQQFTATAQWDRLDFPNIIPTIGTWYEVSGWAKRTSGSVGKTHLGYLQLINGGVTRAITSNDYEQIRIQFLSVSANAVTPYAVQERSTSGFDTVIVDDFSVKPLSISSLFANPGDLGTSDIIASTNLWVPNIGNWSGLACCMDDYDNPQNYLLAVYGGDLTTVKLYQVLNGTPTQLFSSAVSFSANSQSGCELKLIKDGSKVRVYMNNSLVNSEQSIDGAIQNNTKFAMFSSDPSNSIDNVLVFPVTNNYNPTNSKKLHLSRKFVVCDGDSLTANANQPLWINKYPYQLWALLGESDWIVHSTGVGGQTAADANSDASSNIDTLYGIYGNQKNIVVIWAGTNDIAVGTSAADTYSLLSSYVSGRKTAGFQVIILTMIKRGTDAGIESRRQSLNSLITANSAGADQVVDVASDPAFSDVTNTTYYDPDQIHLSATGYSVVAGLVNTAISLV